MDKNIFSSLFRERKVDVELNTSGFVIFQPILKYSATLALQMNPGRRGGCQSNPTMVTAWGLFQPGLTPK